ncbi:MAG: FMN-binding protein [Micromonosporaceae bacterium]|nr:FMN-binding protein [Micromonosporaceae bacterium]
MRRITLWLISTIAILVLVFSYKTSTSGPDHGAAHGNPAAGGAGVVSQAPAGDPATPAGSGNGGGGGGAGKGTVVVNGAVSDTRWGPVQVQVTIASNRITDVKVLQQPDGNRTDAEINSYALPQLREQALSAQSAQIDGVSGATVTSDGYRSSLQSALDAVNFRG